MLFMIRVFVVMLGMILVGCASNHYGGIHGDYTMDSAPEEGLVTFSTRWVFNCPSPTILPSHAINPRLYFEGAGPGFSSLLYNPFVPRHFDEPPGYFFVYSLQSGDYLAKEVQLMIAGTSLSGEVKHSTPFKVRKGNVIYLGELTVTVSGCQYSRSLAKGDVQLKVANKWQRDQELFAERLPKINPTNVVVDLLKLGKRD